MTMSPEESEIRRVEALYDTAWRHGDIDGLLACLRADAVLVNPRGGVARGHEEIRRMLGSYLADEARGTQHSSEILRIEYATDTVALVDGEAHIARPGDGRAAPYLLVHGFTDVLVRNDNRWLIAHVRAYPLPTAP
jgi:uncharacterized protein (TIGR02246 family)